MAAARSYIDRYIADHKKAETKTNYNAQASALQGYYTKLASAQQDYYKKLSDLAKKRQDYATQIMDKAVTAGLKHQDWLEQKQEGLLDTYGQRLKEVQQAPTGKEVGHLMEAGTAEIMRAQQQAMHTVTAGLAARGLLGSSAMESAVAKVAGETAGKIVLLAADTEQKLLEIRTTQEANVMNAMTQVLSIPTFEGYAKLAQAGAAAASFAVPGAAPAPTRPPKGSDISGGSWFRVGNPSITFG